MKNLAGLNRDFRFTPTETHLCGRQRRAPHRLNTETQQLRKNVYEKSKDNVHIGSAWGCLLCRIADRTGKAGADAHPNTDCHAATR